MNEPMNHSKFIKVNCDWQSNVEGKDIENCVVTRFQKFETDTADIDVLDMIEESKCDYVNFTKPEEGEDEKELFVNITCSSKYLIRSVILCSEAKTVELFGKNGEYLSTHASFFSENVNEFSINSHLINIDCTDCSLKLRHLKEEKFVWVYCIFVYITEKKDLSDKSLGLINMQNVQHLVNPESLATNASKLFSSLSLKEPKANSTDFLCSIFNNLQNNKLRDNNVDNQFMSKSLKLLESRVEEKLSSMALQLSAIGNNVEMLNKKFDILLNALHEKNIQ